MPPASRGPGKPHADRLAVHKGQDPSQRWPVGRLRQQLAIRRRFWASQSRHIGGHAAKTISRTRADAGIWSGRYRRVRARRDHAAAGAVRADGWTRVDGIGAGSRCGSHTPDGQRSDFTHGDGWSCERREARPAPVPSPRFTRRRPNARNHHASGLRTGRDPTATCRRTKGCGATAGANLLRSSRRPPWRGARRHVDRTQIFGAHERWRIGYRRRQIFRPARNRDRRLDSSQPQALCSHPVPAVPRLERAPLSHRRQNRAAMCAHAFEKDWIRRIDDTRAVAITPAGERIFRETLGLKLN